ncbi:peptide-methionine (R)-S-oxide reductase [Candidatus Uhrbacteria bacterium CG_4_9_14_3_um_filter_50_9]|uniref:peptide-methionine (R)-S-oxide reductase n=1 Tax=Candidatus Uhrbacteria bacterium CG_4_9_14_3_um_filter_50_9 TaxID=1975035 RepID=A0A2M7XC86_9BACT|nr:MAG: peptide-methionine (R)-S-oxide reductase [Candidatus Uhrbacteria bacterium CG_4_9_14_3_um_filter_50_9]
MDENELKKKLTPEQYRVLREGGTEAPFSGAYVDLAEDGMFHCQACGAPLFSSEQKLDSSKSSPGLAGWPAFDDVVKSDAVITRPDTSGGMRRTEVLCAKCESHLGHVFDDSKEKTGKHFCINSGALNFSQKEDI